MISLVVATVGRVEELERLLASLEAQAFQDFEVLVVDQNPDERLAAVLTRHPKLRLSHLRSERGVSRARNVGLRAAQGSIIAIPDDDCWYPQNLLASVAEWFHSHSEYGGLFVTMRGADAEPIGPKWPGSARPCTRKNAMACVTAINGFLRRSVVDGIGFFNENIGPGVQSKYIAGEDMEYFLRPFRLGTRMWFEPALWVGHPNLHSLERLQRTSYSYALGAGYVMRVHGYSSPYLSLQLARSLAGAALSLCKGDITLARTYAMRAAGQLHGYCFGPRDVARTAVQKTD